MQALTHWGLANDPGWVLPCFLTEASLHPIYAVGFMCHATHQVLVVGMTENKFPNYVDLGLNELIYRIAVTCFYWWMFLLYIYHYYATNSQNKHLILIDCVCFQSLSLIWPSLAPGLTDLNWRQTIGCLIPRKNVMSPRICAGRSSFWLVTPTSKHPPTLPRRL